MEKAQQKKLVKIWVAEMLGGRWEKTKRQKMKKCKKYYGANTIWGGGGEGIFCCGGQLMKRLNWGITFTYSTEF